MTRALKVISCGPSVTVQDRGRPGHLAHGLSRGGAADRLALAEGAALLGQNGDLAALEMAGFGGEFAPTAPMRIALTGAPMDATIDGRSVVWNASHMLAPGQRLRIGAARRGVYGYLHVGGGIDTPLRLGARAVHLACGLGRAMAPGDAVPVGPDAQGQTGQVLAAQDRFSGGAARILASAQTALFTPDTLARFEATAFSRDQRANRQGMRLAFDGAPFAAQGQLNILSEIIVPGDIQMTGDGAPFVLLPECQATGGYPRIGSVIPADLPMVAQAGPGAPLRFRFVDLPEALAAHRAAIAEKAGLRTKLRPLIRDPRYMNDLLSYQLIGGAITGWE